MFGQQREGYTDWVLEIKYFYLSDDYMGIWKEKNLSSCTLKISTLHCTKMLRLNRKERSSTFSSVDCPSSSWMSAFLGLLPRGQPGATHRTKWLITEASWNILGSLRPIWHCTGHSYWVFSKCLNVLGCEDSYPFRLPSNWLFSFVVEDWRWTYAGTRICSPT